MTTTGHDNPANEPIAIIGMACLFPQAPDLRSFWRNILGGLDAISEPVEQWDAGRYLESGRIKTPYGGYLRDLYRFDPREFGIMPNSLDGGEPDQFLALRVARDALVDAGYFGPEVDHRDTGIILGHSTYLHRGQGTLIQNHIVIDQTMELLAATCPQLDAEALAKVRALMQKKVPQQNADISPGLVPNVMTGRIANRLNLKGVNYLVDAACSSSLLAVGAAMDELRAGRARMMLAGGVNASLPAEVSVIFTQLGALSGRGKVRPFDKSSDGTLLGEGLGVVVLKRLSDALADGDRIYAAVRGVGQASDGRGQGLLAPSLEGETLAIERAYRSTGVDPATVGLVEAHGTGIPLGDKTEISALRNVFGERGDRGPSKALGSVKSMISHCIPAAGIAGLIKTALALHHKLLPPTLCDEVNPELGIDRTPFFVNTAALPWIHPADQPRRAGVDSFGFGGINAHAIVEEAPAAAKRPARLTPWSAELCLFAAETSAALVARLQQVAQALERRPEWVLADVAATLLRDLSADAPCRLAIVAKDLPGLAKQIGQAIKKLQKNEQPRWTTRGGLIYSEAPLQGKLAFMFPGEGSQYLGMLSDVALCFPEVREWLDFWRGLYGEPAGASRTDIAFPPPGGLSDERRQQLERRLHEMDVGSEAVFVGGQAMFSLLSAFGVKPDVMVGHSSGESSALAASGAIPAEDRGQLASFIREMNVVYQQVLEAGKIPRGALLAVGALPEASVMEHIAGSGNDIVVAMNNCANQLVLYGQPQDVEKLQAQLVEAGGICMLLPFDRGYHTPAFDEASAAFLKYYRSVGLAAPQVPLYSCASAELFPGKTAGVRQLAAAQWSRTVRFRETVERMHADGVRFFVEVGPSGNLSAFVNDVLASQDVLVTPTNVRSRDGVEQFLSVLGQLFVHRQPVALDRLTEGRLVHTLDFADAAPAKAVGVLLDNTMPVVRLDDQDRETLRAIGAATVSPAPVAASVETGVPESVPAPAEDEAAVDPAQQVMSDYFDVMRQFLDQQGRVVSHLSEVAVEGGLASAPALPHYTPLISAVLEGDEHRLVAACELDLQQQNFLRDHVLSGPVSVQDPALLGLSCVPMMVSLEIMAEAAALLAGTPHVTVIENVRAFDWIALDLEHAQLQVEAERVPGEDYRFAVRLLNEGSTVVSGEFSLEPAWRCAPIPALADTRPSRWQGHELYQTGMFHGRVFQSVRDITGWNAQGMDAQLSPVSLDGFLQLREGCQMVLNPVLLDAVGQVAAYWIAEQIGTDFNCFPSTIARVELYRPCPADLPGIVLKARQAPLDPSATEVEAPRSWDFECVDADGEPLVRISRLVNVFFPVPHRFYQVRRDPLNGWLGRPHSGPVSGMVLWELPHLPDDFCAQSAGIFLRILAHIYLDAEERLEWQALEGSVRRKREWLLGRACLKEAVRHWIFERTGHLLFASDVAVLHDEAGGPWIDGWWADVLIPAPRVSLSHDSRGSIAIVSEGDRPVGVDVEHVGGLKQPELVAQSMTAREQQLLQAVGATRYEEVLLRTWCAKEAAAKLLGTGLQGQPEAFEVHFEGEDLAAAQVAHQDVVIDVTTWCGEEGAVFAVATGLGQGVEVSG
jgi:acyl transferase domain-containing protein/phosphopantetheinyl transferase (holo-ACP synthase)